MEKYVNSTTRPSVIPLRSPSPDFVRDNAIGMTKSTVNAELATQSKYDTKFINSQKNLMTDYNTPIQNQRKKANSTKNTDNYISTSTKNYNTELASSRSFVFNELKKMVSMINESQRFSEFQSNQNHLSTIPPLQKTREITHIQPNLLNPYQINIHQIIQENLHLKSKINQKDLQHQEQLQLYAKNSFKNLSKQNNQIQQLNKALETQNSKLKQLLSQRQQKLQQLYKQSQVTQNNTIDYQRIIKENLIFMSQQIKQTDDQTSNKINTNMIKLENIQKYLKKLSEELKSLRYENYSLKQQNYLIKQSYQLKCKDLNDIINQNNSQIQQIKLSTQIKVKQLVQTFQKQLQLLRNQINQKNFEIKQCNTTKNHQAYQFQQKIYQKQQQIIKLNHNLLEGQEKHKKLNQKIQELKNLIILQQNRLNKRADDLTLQLQQKQFKYTQLQNLLKHRNIAGELKQIKNILNLDGCVRLQEQMRQLNISYEQQTFQFDENVTKIDKLSRQLLNFQQKFVNFEREKALLVQKVNYMDMNISIYKTQLKQKNEICQNLIHQNTNLQNQIITLKRLSFNNQNISKSVNNAIQVSQIIDKLIQSEINQ